MRCSFKPTPVTVSESRVEGVFINRNLPGAIGILHTACLENEAPPPFNEGEISGSRARGIMPRAKLLDSSPPMVTLHGSGRGVWPDIGKGNRW
ncbi:MAG: hypothetical protein IIC64_14145 [SAR324 cluster bacterium]|nr:hypothetical protein [SAR324 cluster bacterium]